MRYFSRGHDVSILTAELSINYLKKPYFVTVSTFHMGILLPFNGSDQLTAKFLMECTRLQEKELLKHVQVLLDAKILTTEVRTLWTLRSELIYVSGELVQNQHETL